MSELITLREAGIPYPDISILKPIQQRLADGRGFQSVFAGGYLRDLVLLGHTRQTPDIDAFMHVKHYDSWRIEDADDLRDQFILHPPHLKFIARMIANGTYHEVPRPLVVNLKPEFMATWQLDIPLQVVLTRQPLQVAEVIANLDFGFNGIASDAEEIWVTPAFLKDRAARTITLQRCANAREFKRNMQRATRLQASRYSGWTPIIPEHFKHFIAA